MNGFDLFYENYPRKKERGDAKKAWDKLKPDEAMEKKIMLALAAQKKYRLEALSAGKFVPDWKYPATWLNKGCYDDEIESIYELREKQNAQIEVCKCGRKATQQGGLCARCWTDKHAPAQRGSSSEIPRRDGESPLDYIRRSLKRKQVEGSKKQGPVNADPGGGTEEGGPPYEYGPEDQWNHG